MKRQWTRLEEMKKAKNELTANFGSAIEELKKVKAAKSPKDKELEIKNRELELTIERMTMQMKNNEYTAKLKLEIVQVEKNGIQKFLEKAEVEKEKYEKELEGQRERFEKESKAQQEKFEKDLEEGKKKEEELKKELEATRRDWRLELDEHHEIYKQAMAKSQESFEKETQAKIDQIKAENAKEMKMKEELFELKLQLALQKCSLKE